MCIDILGMYSNNAQSINFNIYIYLSSSSYEIKTK